MLPREKSDNFYHLFDGGDIGTKSAKVKKRVSESEAWLAKIILFCTKFQLALNVNEYSMAFIDHFDNQT